MNSLLPCRRARLSVALCVVLLPLALAGCGNKGPLVLPEDATPAPAVAPPAPTPAASPAEAPSADAPTDDAPADTPDPPHAHD